MKDTTDYRLYNSKNLAEVLGVKPLFIKRMKAAGFKMPGMVATAQWALDWLRAHPDFVPNHYATPRKYKMRKR